MRSACALTKGDPQGCVGDLKARTAASQDTLKGRALLQHRVSHGVEAFRSRLHRPGPKIEPGEFVFVSFPALVDVFLTVEEAMARI